MIIKFVLDNGVQLFFKKEMLTIADFLIPLNFDLGATSTEHLLIRIASSLPFLWIGLSMSVRRAANAKLPPEMGLLFVLPYINLMLMLALKLIPDRNKKWGLVKEPLNESNL